MFDIEGMNAYEILEMLHHYRSLTDAKLNYETMRDCDRMNDPVSMGYCEHNNASVSEHLRCWADVANAAMCDSDVDISPANTININIIYGDDLMDFGKALKILKKGGRVTRKGWNGKGTWLALTKGSTIPKDLARCGAVLKLAEEGVDEITINDHIDMRTAEGSICCGWVASQADMLSEDWVQVRNVRGWIDFDNID